MHGHVPNWLDALSLIYLVLLRCCKRLCILGPHGAIEMCYYYYYFFFSPSVVKIPRVKNFVWQAGEEISRVTIIIIIIIIII